MSQTTKVRGVATSVRREVDGTLVVRYHSTDVVTVQPDGTVILKTGGWKSNTTKLRMNQAAHEYNLPYRVGQKDFSWFVTVKDGRTLNFDGDTLTIRREETVAA